MDVPAENNSTHTWLDTDGTVAHSDKDDVNSTFAEDLQWHMVTLTSLPGNSKGFQIFLDGRLRGQMLPGVTYTGEFGGFGIRVFCWGLRVGFGVGCNNLCSAKGFLGSRFEGRFRRGRARGRRKVRLRVDLGGGGQKAQTWGTKRQRKIFS